MSDETYYTVLNVKETASSAEIKTAYRDIIKQVHPDTIANLAPYLRKIAEDKAKEINEAYTVLSNSSKRRDYDRQLAEYRRQTTPQETTPQPTPPNQAASQTASTSSGNKSPAATPQPRVVRWLGYNWGPLMRWAGKHPVLLWSTILLSVVFMMSLYPDLTSQSTSQADKQPFTNKAAAASTGPNSQYPCDLHDKVSPIDGKPCSKSQDQSVPDPPPGVTLDQPRGSWVVVGEEDVEKAKPKGSSVIDLRKNSVIDLRNNSASNARDTQTESSVTPGLANLPRYWVLVCQANDKDCKWNSPPFQVWVEGADVHESRLTSSGVGAEETECVTHRNGSGWLGFCFYTFTWTNPRLSCRVKTSELITKIMPSTIIGVVGRVDMTPLKDGMCPVAGTDSLDFTLVPQPPRLTGSLEQGNVKPRPKATEVHALVNDSSYSVFRRCAYDTHGNCDDVTVAQLNEGDRVTVLSPLTRAENGDDIYEVRTEQGLVGWINATGITLKSQ